LLSSLTLDEVCGVVLAGCKEELAKAKARGDKAYASDLSTLIRHETAKLTKAPHAAKLKRAKHMKQIVAEIDRAQDNGLSLPDDVDAWFRQYVKEQAGDIRFGERFGDVLARLEDGETIEFMGEDDLLIAAARTRPAKPGRTWREVDLVSSVIPGRREYIDLRYCEDNTPWLPWRRYCEAAEAERARLAMLAANPAEAAPATKGGRR
jgi:hypothetical protein